MKATLPNKIAINADDDAMKVNGSINDSFTIQKFMLHYVIYAVTE
jgi:hypothetical protein